MTAAPRPPVDQATRDRIVSGVDRSCLVEASAGTGKTRLLVDRVLTILRTGTAPIDRIAAITFTEKAAGELKSRVRAALDAAWRDASPDSPDRGRYGAAIRDLDRAVVTTIHAFCSEILKAHPVEARVSPGYRVADADMQRVLLDEAREAWKEEELENLDSELGTVLRTGGQFHWMNELTRILVENRDLLREESCDLLDGPVPDPEPEFARFRAAVAPERIGEIDALLSRCGAPGTCRAFAAVSAALPAIRRFAARLTPGDPRAVDRAAAGVFVPKIRKAGRKGDWPAGALDALRERVIGIEETQAAFIRAQRSRAAVLAVRGLSRLVDMYERKKTEQGLLDFQDLLIRTRDLVRDHPEARRRLREAYSVLLVDEFQDTDPLQAEIVFLLAGADTQEKDWRKARVDPGRLFLVGDPKQSIYRFRRADIQVYEQARRTLEAAGGEVLPITVNFRTRGGITDWVNRVFARLMPPAEADAHHPAYSPLHAYRTDVPGLPSPVIALAVPDPPGEETGVTGKRKAEATAVAHFLRDRIGSRTLLRMGRDGAVPADYGDVAVLFRMTTGLDIYEDVFREAGVPYRVEGGRYYFQRLEVQSLLSALRAVDRPNDREALVAALRSPLFGFDDEELAIAAAENSLRYGAHRTTSNRRLAAVLDRMEEWHLRRHVDSPAVIVEEILEVTRAIEFFSLQSLGAQRAANLLKLADEAAAYGGEAGAFRVFVEHLSDREAREEAEEESPISEEADRGFVRFLTVHKSKGLEFPITILADPSARPRSGVEALFDRGTGRMAVALKALGGGPGHTPGWDELLELERTMSAAEEKRLFYVAATRTRDLLLLPVTGKPATSGFLRLLEPGDLPAPVAAAEIEAGRAAAAERGAGESTAFTAAPEAAPPPRAPRGAAGPQLSLFEDSAGTGVAEARDRFARERRALLEGLPRAPRVVSPSALHREEAPAPARPAVRGAGEDGGRALELGSLVHRVLEIVDASGDDLDRVLARLAPGFRLLTADDLATARRLADTAIRHPVWTRATSARRCYREAPFLAVESERLHIDGFADLVYEEDGDLVVVDFKTDRLAGRDVPTLAARYRGQALGYALGVSRAAARRVRAVILLFLDGGNEHRIEVDDALLEEARRAAEE